jgi:SAM-dependent methyltransferase
MTTPCRLCGGASEPAFATIDRNRKVDGTVFTYLRCGSCGTVFLRDVPDDLARWYPDDYFVFPSVAELDAMGADRTETYKIEAVLPHVRGGRLVEVGPGFGVFARRAAVAGFDVCGLEMDAACCAHLRDVVGVQAIQTVTPEAALDSLPPSDAIAMWHSLEHVRDPWALVAAAAHNLRPGGVLAMALPNPQALGFRLFGGRWPHVDAPRHLHLIPARPLVDRGAAEGLERVSLTSDDGGARHWNEFGWGRVVLPPAPGYVLTRLSSPLGRLIAAVAAPAERRPGRGSAYTLVLRKPPA